MNATRARGSDAPLSRCCTSAAPKWAVACTTSISHRSVLHQHMALPQGNEPPCACVAMMLAVNDRCRRPNPTATKSSRCFTHVLSLTWEEKCFTSPRPTQQRSAEASCELVQCHLLRGALSGSPRLHHGFQVQAHAEEKAKHAHTYRRYDPDVVFHSLAMAAAALLI